MSAASRVIASLAAMALSTTIVSASLAASSASIQQVRNGPADAPSTPIPTWGTGNAGASNSHYLESHSIAYRAVLDGMPTDGTVIEMVVGYDVKRSGSYALDYLTHFQRLLPHVLFGHREPEVFDPLAGVTGVDATVSTAPIPIVTRNVVIDPDGSESEPAAPQPSTSMTALTPPEREMTLYGGTLIDVSYVTEADPSLATRSSETQVKVRFTASSPKAVLAWGGHIASRWDWGFNQDGSPRSAGGISGSSYHMRLVGWNLGSLGNQDRSMSTDAVYPVPRCGISNLGPFCAGSTNTHTAPSGMESYSWSLFDNTCGAVIVGGDTGLSIVVRSATAGSYSLMLTTGASGFTRQCQATVTVNAPVDANAGLDLVVCASSPQVQLAGMVSGGSGTWSGGSGSYSPSAGDPNAIYTPSAAEIAAGGVTLTLTCTPAVGPCPPVSDQVRLTINRLATANAGPDQTVCASNPQVQLAGAVGGGATSGTWSGGDGAFSPGASSLNATYTPTPAEIAAGGVTLTLTTDDPNGPCPAVSDQVRLTISASATADAGTDPTVCASSPQVQLAGSVGGTASSGSWSGGAGSFSPNRSALNALYTPTAAEIAAGGVTLTLNSNDPAGPCLTASDQVRITILPAATVNAGPDQTVCATSAQVQLAGSVGGAAAGGTWSGGAGNFSPSSSALAATYTPSAAEIAAGGVTLTLTTNDPSGPCPPVSDQVHVTISPAATVNAGPDQVVCASSPQVQLAGSVGGSASSATWSGGAGSFSPKSTNLNASYTPTAAEIAAGSVTLILTTNDPSGPCPSVSDQVRITIDPITVVNAGPDQTVCSSSPQVTLHGSVSGTVTSGAWSGGTGTFSPGAGALNATYTPSPAEIAAGTVTLVLTSAASSGPCPRASDQMTIFISQAVTVNAGPDQIVCAVSPQVQLAGSVGNGATSGSWGGGAGTFSPNASALNAVYAPSAGEIAAGSVTLTLTTNDPAGPCPAVSDQMKVTIDSPEVTIPNRIVCTGISPVTMCANASDGIAPYTYRWNTGATTQCIAVSDTGSYAVTITDAKGCQASASGVFRQRECIGQLAHTSTTCATFMAGTGEDLSEVHYVVKDNIITSISPGVFFYYSKVTAPSANFTVLLVQTKDNPYFPFCEVQQDQVVLYDSDCTRVGTGTETSPGQASINVQGATVGQVFIISVKYSLKSLVGTYMPPDMGAHYDFHTMINGQIVDSDPDGLQIGADISAIVGVDPLPDIDRLALYRPVPNPFTNGMRMAYSVGPAGEMVTIGVYDVAGRLVRTLANGFQSPGRHLAQWDGRDERGTRMRGGVYFVRARVGNQARHVRVLFLD
jgi:hypothetical protein